MTQQTSLNGSASEKLFGSMNNYSGNKKIPIDIRRRLYQAIVVNIALWGSESWALKDRVQTGSFPPWMSPQDVRADVGCSRETDHE
jgi:hypothetical protein